MTKLTKDQKRAKAKREEQKRQRTRQHILNAQANVVDKALMTLGDSMLGNSSVEEIEQELLRVAKGIRPADRRDPFTHPAWGEHKPRISNLVGMLRAATRAVGRGMPMLGRVYLIDQEDMSFSTISVPLVMREIAPWKPEEVVQKIAEELSITPAEGIYCYGILLGQAALHFAVVHVGGEDGFTEHYLVTPKQWIFLDPIKHAEHLQDLITFTRKQTIEEFGLRESDKMLMLHLYSTPEELKKDAEKGDSHRRQFLIALLQDAMEECDVILEVAQKYADKHSNHTYEAGWSEGYSDGTSEMRELKEAMLEVSNELQATKVKAAAAALNQAGAFRAAQPLHLRMGHLLTPVHIR